MSDVEGNIYIRRIGVIFRTNWFFLVEDFLLRVGFHHEKRMTMQACGMCMDIFCSRA